MPSHEDEEQGNESKSLGDLGMKRYIARINPPDDDEVHGTMEIVPDDVQPKDNN